MSQSEEGIRIVILDHDEVFITREQADRLEAHGDMATYRMSYDELMDIIEPGDKDG